ncbi:hypothetical protein QQM79_20910 [Marinobacteraceae bacterium S3BR75-40.1]
MEVKIGFGGINAKIPATQIGLNVASYAYIQMRASKNSLPVTYAIDENVTFGNQGANLLSILATEWFEVKPSDSEFTDEKDWFRNWHQFRNMHGEIEIKGGLYLGMGKGSVDVVFGVIDQKGNYTEIINKRNRKATGVLVSDAKLSGPLRFKAMTKAG